MIESKLKANNFNRETAVSTWLGLVSTVKQQKVSNRLVDRSSTVNAHSIDLRLTNVTCKRMTPEDKSRMSCRCHDKDTVDK